MNLKEAVSKIPFGEFIKRWSGRAIGLVIILIVVFITGSKLFTNYSGPCSAAAVFKSDKVGLAYMELCKQERRFFNIKFLENKNKLKMKDTEILKYIDSGEINETQN